MTSSTDRMMSRRFQVKIKPLGTLTRHKGESPSIRFPFPISNLMVENPLVRYPFSLSLCLSLPHLLGVSTQLDSNQLDSLRFRALHKAFCVPHGQGSVRYAIHRLCCAEPIHSRIGFTVPPTHKSRKLIPYPYLRTYLPNHLDSGVGVIRLTLIDLSLRASKLRQKD